MRKPLSLLPILILAAFVPTPTLAREIHASVDASFVRQALRADSMEEKLAKAALARINGAAVRAVAHLILKRDPDSVQTLRQATHASGLTQPKEKENNSPVEAPRSAISYLAQDVAEKRAMVSLFRDEARHGGKPVLREFAQTRLPLIQSELLAAERGERRVAGAASKPAGYALPKPWPSITPMGRPPSTTPPEPEG